MISLKEYYDTTTVVLLRKTQKQLFKKAQVKYGRKKHRQMIRGRERDQRENRCGVKCRDRFTGLSSEAATVQSLVFIVLQQTQWFR